jgi:hypothetical protein
MSIASYNFSERGIMHIENDLPCQDSSDVMSYGLWRVAIVADGVGSCEHSDEASRIAVKSALKTVYNCFPNNCKEEDILSLITMAFHCAANSIEMHVKKINGKLQEYHTTLAMALYDGKNLYFGNAGDSGIIALDDYGDYHVVTSQQNNEYGEVITLSSRTFVVGKADFNVVAVLCMTDGVFEWVVPGSKVDSDEKDEKKVYVPRANLFIQPNFWDNKQKTTDDLSTLLKECVTKEFNGITSTVASNDNNKALLQVYGSLDEGNLRDDISVSAIVNYGADISSEDIKWTPPAEPTIEEMYCKKWKEILRLYPSVAKKAFLIYVSQNNTSWTHEEVEAYAEHIWDITTNDENEASNSPNPDTHSKHEVTEMENSADSSIKSDDASDDTNGEFVLEGLLKNFPQKKQGSPLHLIKKGIRSFLEIEDSEKTEGTTNESEE